MQQVLSTVDIMIILFLSQYLLIIMPFGRVVLRMVDPLRRKQGLSDMRRLLGQNAVCIGHYVSAAAAALLHNRFKLAPGNQLCDRLCVDARAS